MRPNKSENKKTYSEPKLQRLDPNQALTRIEAAAEAGNESAQAMLGFITGKKSELRNA